MRYLSEKLFEVIVDQWLELGQAGQRCVVAHRTKRLLAVGHHINNIDVSVPVVSKKPSKTQQNPIKPNKTQ